MSNSNEYRYIYSTDIENEKRIKDLQRTIENIEKRIVSKSLFDTRRQYKIDYAQALNLQQLTAVAEIDTPLLVIAGAGSGKTRVIIYKVAYLIENGVHPRNILLLSFTHKSSREMLERVHGLLGDRQAKLVQGGTFHSFANRMLRVYSSLINISPSFTIIDAQDASDIIDVVKREISISKQSRPFPKKGKVKDIISKSRNIEISIKETIERYFPETIDFTLEVQALSTLFAQYKKTHNLFDYDDLLEVLLNSLRENDVFRQEIQKDIAYLLVDEYQDTNNVQRKIVELLVGDRTGVTVVGDDAQSIYSFRGANYENILRFPETFPSCVCVKIEENYRSGQEILDFTNEVISNARIGFQKKLHAQYSTGNKPVIKEFVSEHAEAIYIVEHILKEKEQGGSYSNSAVLVRASWHSNYVQAELMKHNIPFVVVGGIRFSERKHIKDLVAFLRLVHNPRDASAWHRILRFVKGIGKIRAQEVIKHVGTHNDTINFHTLKDKKYYADLVVYEKFYADTKDKTPAQMIEGVLSLFYTEILKNTEEDYEIRLKDLETLRNIAEEYTNLEEFLSDFALETSQQQGAGEYGTPTKKDAVVVSTIHSAKGLEWHTVYIPFTLEGFIPSARALKSLEEIEEERRLFYVATSRAKECLYITRPSSISSWGSDFSTPSRFISEIGDGWYETQ